MASPAKVPEPGSPKVVQDKNPPTIAPFSPNGPSSPGRQRNTASDHTGSSLFTPFPPPSQQVSGTDYMVEWGPLGELSSRCIVLGNRALWRYGNKMGWSRIASSGLDSWDVLAEIFSLVIDGPHRREGKRA